MGYKRLGSHLTQGHLNDAFDALEKQAVFQHGRGVLSGCHLSAVKGALKVVCTGGLVTVESARQVMGDEDIVVPANAVSYVWRSEEGGTLVTPTPEPVGGLFVCVGRVVTGSSEPLLCDGAGRMEPARMNPHDPRSYVVRAELLPKGPLHLPVAERFIDEDLVLTPSDRNIQVIDGGLSERRVSLPGEPHYGNWFRVVNSGDADLVLYDGEREIARLAPCETVELGVRPRRAKPVKGRHAAARKAARFKDRSRNEWHV